MCRPMSTKGTPHSSANQGAPIRIAITSQKIAKPPHSTLNGIIAASDGSRIRLASGTPVHSTCSPGSSGTSMGRLSCGPDALTPQR